MDAFGRLAEHDTASVIRLLPPRPLQNPLPDTALHMLWVAQRRRLVLCTVIPDWQPLGSSLTLSLTPSGLWGCILATNSCSSEEKRTRPNGKL